MKFWNINILSSSLSGLLSTVQHLTLSIFFQEYQLSYFHYITLHIFENPSLQIIMHITLTHSLFLLGIFVYSSAALVLQQTSRLSPTEGFQNSLGFSVDKGTAVSPTAVADFKQFVQTSLFAVPSSVSCSLYPK